MQIFLTTFTAVAMLLTIGILGYWLISRKVIAGPVLGPLSVLAIDIALPCLIFAGILTKFNPAQHTDWWNLILWWAGAQALFTVLAFVFSLVSKAGHRREFRVSLLFQNGIFFPLAIIAEMFGTGSFMIVQLFLYTLFYPAFFFNTAPLFFRRGLKLKPARILNPVLAATLLAVAVRYTGLDGFVPKFLMEGIRMVGAMSVPLLMLVLGGTIYLDMSEIERPSYGENLKFVAVKNILFPLATLGVLTVVRPPYAIAFIIMLQAAVPPVTAVPVITGREGGNRNIVTQFMVASFLCSLITLPLMITIFSRFFTPG
ncbi:MAG TPA: AEC family transporter [Deltaproteobacteria bacterium]|jgi:hypothetical protein|nr:AEC family transporter [Deltaproteobacteria bacterium]HOI06458.1 AEC family transporter [Deltaproteobacteria bacterium]